MAYHSTKALNEHFGTFQVSLNNILRIKRIKPSDSLDQGSPGSPSICQSIYWSIHWSISLSIYPSIHPSIHPSVMHLLKPKKVDENQCNQVMTVHVQGTCNNKK
jgi:hypothetical protein